jgi:hypothetical protein
MFEEIPAPAPPPSQRITIAGFGILFVTCVIASVFAWFHWSGPMSLSRKIGAGEFIVGGVLSGVFLLTAKSATPESNQKRLFGLYVLLWLPQLIVDLLR